MQYTSKLTLAEMEMRLKAVQNNDTIFFSTNRPFLILRNENEIVLKSMMFKSRIVIDKADTQKFDLQISFLWVYYVIPAFVSIFFLSFLLSNNVTINGNAEPTIIEQFKFIFIGCALLLVPFIILLNFKSNVEKHLKEILELAK